MLSSGQFMFMSRLAMICREDPVSAYKIASTITTASSVVSRYIRRSYICSWAFVVEIVAPVFVGVGSVVRSLLLGGIVAVYAGFTVKSREDNQLYAGRTIIHHVRHVIWRVYKWSGEGYSGRSVCVVGYGYSTRVQCMVEYCGCLL